MNTLTRLLAFGTLLLPLTLAGCDKGGDEAANEDETGDDDTTGEDETETGETEPLDSDEDGLPDDVEVELGTDPLKKDTDGDNYWDPWEIDEGTDPLDYDSRIYTGFWPYNPNKDELDPGSWSEATTAKGSRFPRDSFLDHHGDMVDVYDFTNFTSNETGQPSYFIADISAQWCGPCHNVANWVAGVDSPDTAWIQEAYPTVRDKVHSLRIWWLTFIVQDANQGPPTISDATTWFEAHKDNYVPILVDAEQEALGVYNSGAFPNFFLLTPTMEVEYFPGPNDGTNEDPYPAVGLVDEYL